MAKVSLTIKTGNVKESEIFEIDRITTLQVLKLKTEVGAILKELKANGELTNVLEGLIGGDMKPSDIADMNQKEMMKRFREHDAESSDNPYGEAHSCFYNGWLIISR